MAWRAVVDLEKMDTKTKILNNLARSIVETDAPCATKEQRLYFAGYIDALLWARGVLSKESEREKLVYKLGHDITFWNLSKRKAKKRK